MIRALLSMVLFLIVVSGAQAEEGGREAKFRSLQLVMLMANPQKPEISQEEVTRFQDLHIAHLTRMTEEGKILVAGPFSEQDDPAFRGLCLYDVGSLDQARRLAESDPAVQAGRMKVQVMTWWFHADRLVFPLAPRVEEPQAVEPASR